jgi:integrase
MFLASPAAPPGEGETQPLETCGLILIYPHDGAKTDIVGRPDQGIRAMRQSVASGKSPHVAGKDLPTERDYLRPDEVKRLIIAAGKRGRNPVRDVVLLRLTFRHGLRAKEAPLARWSQFDLDNPGTKTFHVQRVKGSEDSTHTLDRDEVAGLRS